MTGKKGESAAQRNLRLQALERVAGVSKPTDPRANPSTALAVLHNMALSPATAADSLKLLHELQVHQVELDLQEEELHRSVAELEAALYRQAQLYDFAPASSFTVDRATILSELNRTGALMLGSDRDSVLGRALDSFLEPASGRALHAVLARVAGGAERVGCELRFAARDGAPHAAYAAVGPDPSGKGFLITCVEVNEPGMTAAR